MTLYTLPLSQRWPDVKGCDVLHVSFLRRRGRSRSTEEVVGYFWQIDEGDYQGFLKVRSDFVLCPAGNQEAMTVFLDREKCSDGIAHALVRNYPSLAQLNYVYHNQAW